MRCLECGSQAVTERPERTAQGYRRFRCRQCGKQFNERSGTLLNRTQYPSDVIALVVLWRLRYKRRPWCARVEVLNITRGRRPSGWQNRGGGESSASISPHSPDRIGTDGAGPYPPAIAAARKDGAQPLS